MHVPELYWLQVPFFVTIKNAEMLFQINVYIFYTSPRKATTEPRPPPPCEQGGGLSTPATAATPHVGEGGTANDRDTGAAPVGVRPAALERDDRRVAALSPPPPCAPGPCGKRRATRSLSCPPPRMTSLLVSLSPAPPWRGRPAISPLEVCPLGPTTPQEGDRVLAEAASVIA